MGIFLLFLPACESVNSNLKLAQAPKVFRDVLSVNWRKNIDPDWQYNPLTWQLFPEEQSTPYAEEGGEIVCSGSTRRRVSCFEKERGLFVWSKEVNGRVVAQPIIFRDKLFVGTTSGIFYAFSKKNGRILWKYRGEGEILSRAAVYFPEENPKRALVIFTTALNQIVALRLESGKWEWQHRHSPPSELTVRGQSPPVIDGERVFCGYSDGTLIAYRAKDGKIIWKKKVSESDEFADIDEPPVIAEGLLLAAPYNSPLMALDPETGKVRWRSKLKRARSPLVSDGELFATTSDGKVASIDLEDGKIQWIKKIPEAGALTAPVADDYSLFVGSSQGGLYVLSRDNGKVIQTVFFGSSFAKPQISENTLFAISYNGFVYSFHISTSRFE